MEQAKTPAKLAPEQVVFLERCAALEISMAGLYRHYERLFVHYPPLALLWRKTSWEEENHARQFQLGARLKGAGLQPRITDLAAANEYLAKVEAFLAAELERCPSGEEALALALELEQKVAQLHMSSIVLFDQPELKALFEALMKFDNDHVASIRQFQKELKAKLVEAEARYAG